MHFPAPHDDAGERVLALVRHQFSGDRAALRRELLGAAREAQVDTEWLAEAWAAALHQLGDLAAVEEPQLHLREDHSLVAEVSLHCDRGELCECVTFDARGRVAEVALLPKQPRG